jgi:hypothetical protein
MDSAIYYTDVETGDDIIEVTLMDGKKNWLYTLPKGDWVRLNLWGVNYADFLRTMVEPNIDILRKIAKLEIRRVHRRSIKAMRCLRTLDPSFDVPYINKNSKWQMDMVISLNTSFAHSAIESCVDQWALMTYANEVRAVR